MRDIQNGARSGIFALEEPMATLSSIEQFLAERTLALAGAARCMTSIVTVVVCCVCLGCISSMIASFTGEDFPTVRQQFLQNAKVFVIDIGLACPAKTALRLFANR
jgi:hypothetical protein